MAIPSSKGKLIDDLLVQKSDLLLHTAETGEFCLEKYAQNWNCASSLHIIKDRFQNRVDISTYVVARVTRKPPENDEVL
jgi:hypothetical protein